MNSLLALLYNSAFGIFNEFDHFLHVSRIAQSFLHLLKSLGSVLFGTHQQFERALKSLNALGRKPLSLQANGVGAKTLGFALRNNQREWQHILGNNGAGANVRVFPKPAELMHW